MNNNSGNQSNQIPSQGAPIGASPNMLGSLPGASPAGSHMPGNPSAMGRMEQSNLQELSHS